MESTGERQPLSFDDAQILGLESSAIMGHTLKVLVLGPGPRGRLDVAALRERVGERIGDAPRLRLRLDKSSAEPAWVLEEEIDLGWHVAEAGTEALDEAAFRAAVGELMGERLDHERPLWRLDVIPLEGDRTGIVGRFHHALADGVTAIRTVGGLLWDAAAPGEAHAQKKSARPAAKTAAKGGAKAASEDAGGGPGRIRKATRLPRALARELRPGRSSPLDRHIGRGREVAWVSVPLERLKAVERSAGEAVTVNDVVLAVVAGALRRWLEASHVNPHGIRAQVPVCLHLRDDSDVGNRDSFLNVDLPLDEPDPLERLRRINAETSARKLDHDAETLYKFFHALGHFKPLYSGVTRVTSGPREFALSVSNVPGPREPVMILGHEVAEFSSFAEPADRHALRVSVVSIGGVLAFGVCSDPDAVPDMNRLADALEESIEELEAGV